ncbi:MAG: MFS transporter [Candidatus Saganbacteria bacterium]|nr:MFS transporter [Candidatus Saganbacteria bacterium]
MWSRINLIQCLSYAAMMASSIFIPLLAKDMGASNFAIGVILTVYALMFFLSSFIFGALADRLGHLKFIRWGLILSVIAFAVQIFISNLYSFVLIRALAGWVLGIFPAALTAYAHKEREGRMGQFNAYGSLGWAVGAVVAGILAAYNTVFLVSAVFLLIAFLFSYQLGKEVEKPKAPEIPLALLKKDGGLYLAFLIRNTGAQMIWAIFPLFLLTLGASRFCMGVLFFINAIFQFFVMQYFENLDNHKQIYLGLILSAVTFAGYGFVSSWVMVIPFQILLAFSFAFLQVGMYQELLMRHEEKATIGGILNAILNLSAVLGPFLAGLVSEFYGYRGTMFAATFLAVVAVIIIRSQSKQCPVRT